MQATLSFASAPGLDAGDRPLFKVVIAYEDLETGKHAKRVYDFLTQNLGTDCEFANQMWKFEVLSVPKLREIAVKDAFEADILMIASRGGPELSAGVRAWIETWLAQGTSAIALVALFSCEVQETKIIRNYLAEVARRGGLGFFAQPDEWPGNGPPMDEVAARWQQARNGSAAMPLGFIAREVEPAGHWGLNE